MKTWILAFAVSFVVFFSACGSVNQMSSAVTGRPTEYRYEDGVRCYYSQSGSLSCVVVRP